MVKRFIPLVLVFLSCISAVNPVMSQNNSYAVGARQAGLGRSSVALTDFWSIQNNQAGIATIESISFGFYYQSDFNISQLSTKSLAGFVPTKFGVIGATFNYFGYSLYHEMKAGLVYSRSFGKYFRIGLQLDYFQTSFGNEYGKAGNVTFELGIQSDISKNVTLGAWVFNPVQVRLSPGSEESIPAVFRLGAGWFAMKGFLTTLEVEKSTDFNPFIVRGGIEYGIKDMFFMRGGFSTQQEIFSMGFGLKFKNLSLDLSAVFHESLGFSEQASLICGFK